MCKVSVIVPVYNVERYLRHCMETLIAQTLEDIEIIVVNDGSTDNSLTILEEYETKYAPKLKVFTITNHGVSYARNYGAEQASGEYLMFVDSDDYVEPELCQLLYEKAKNDNNDIVLCYRNDVYEHSTKEDVEIKTINTMTANQNFTMEENPYELVWLTPFPWDKMVRRDLFFKVRFPEGIRFEDLAYILKITCIAENIGIVRQPLYNYRRMTGGFLNTFSEATLDIIKAFDNVIDFMKENNLYDKYEEEIAYICARHFFFRYPVILDKTNKEWKLKKRIVKDTQDFLNDQFPNWKENHYLKYSSSQGIKRNLSIYRNKHKLMAILTLERIVPKKVWDFCINGAKKAQSFFRGLKKARSKSKFISKKFKILRLAKMPATYKYTKAYLRYSVDKNMVLFESKHGEDIAGNIFQMLMCFHQKEEFSKYQLCLALKNKAQNKWEQLSRNYGLNRVKIIALNSKEYYQALASAGYLITDTSFPTYYVKKTEQVYLNTWHGTPLKGMGRQVPGREFGLGNVQRNFLIADWLLYQNEFSRDVFIDDYMIRNIYPGKIMLSGYPRNSALMNQEIGEKIRETNGWQNKKLIAYMPTWRGVLHKKNFAKQINIVFQYLAQLDMLLTDNTIFLVKLHPFVGDTIKYDSFKHIQPFPAEYETYDFLNATDMLVTDYSSIMFDYAVSGKKIILFAYDREEYLHERGMYIDLNKVEFPVVETVGDLVKEFSSPNTGYKLFQKEYCKYDSRSTAEDVCRTLISDKQFVKCETTPRKDDNSNVLIFVEGVGNKAKLEKIIDEVNNLSHDEKHYYLAFTASAIQKNTEMLQKLNPKVGYLALQSGINALLRDYYAKRLFQKYGCRTRWIQKRLDAFGRREAEKFFGQADFSEIIYYSGRNVMNLKMLSCMTGKKICNLTAYTQKMYDASKEYRRYVKTAVSGTIEFDAFCINKEFLQSSLYEKTKDRINYRVMENQKNNIHDLMEG